MKKLSPSTWAQDAKDVRIAVGKGESLPANADIVLLPERAAFLPKTSTVVCSDIHLGKAATFRHAGMPIPEGSAQHDLKRLLNIIDQYNARRLLITGDLFHARSGCTPQVLEEFSEFCKQVQSSTRTNVVLVLGNHEQSLGKKFRPYEIGISRCENEIIEPPFHFVHDQTKHSDVQPGSFMIAGHIHPTITVKGTSGDQLTSRCFVAAPNLLILPAFGFFTGGSRIKTNKKHRVWLAGENEVHPLPWLS